MRNPLFHLLILLALCGCVSLVAPVETGFRAKGGQVGMNDISDELVSNQRMVLASNESFIPPLDDDSNAPPGYPAALLGQSLDARVVCLQIAVAADGTVSASHPVEHPPRCPRVGELDPQMLASASNAVAGWRFEPGLRCIFPDIETKQTTYGSCGESKSVAEPVSLTYRFIFEQKDGKGHVHIGGASEG